MTVKMDSIHVIQEGLSLQCVLAGLANHLPGPECLSSQTSEMDSPLYHIQKH